MTQVSLHSPARESRGMRPLKAWRHFRKLIANKEDTEQVFHILDALRDNRFSKSTANFFRTAEGQRVLEERPYLPELLDNHAQLKKLPEGSVGRAYVDFMEREGLTAQGLVDEYAKFGSGKSYGDLVEIYGDRLRDTHDLFHILTGYGRDALGEQCVLAFSYGQTPSWGTLFIAYAGAREIKKGAIKSFPIYQAVREGQRNGRLAKQISYQNIESLLAENLESARQRLGIKPPLKYQEVHRMMRANDVDPYDLLGQNADKAEDKPQTAIAA